MKTGRFVSITDPTACCGLAVCFSKIGFKLLRNTWSKFNLLATRINILERIIQRICIRTPSRVLTVVF